MGDKVKAPLLPEDINWRGRPLTLYSKEELLDIIVELHEELLRNKKRHLQDLHYYELDLNRFTKEQKC